MKLNTLILAASLGLAVAPGARAGLIFSSTNETVITSVNLGQTRYSLAQSFEGNGHAVTSIHIGVQLLTPVNGASGNLVFSVYDNAVGVPGLNPAGVPGSLLATLSGPTSPTDAGSYYYDWTGSSLTLSANTYYWVVGTVTAGGGGTTYPWSFDGAGGVPAVGTSIHARGNFNGRGWTNSYNSDLLMTVDAVPEPSQWAMCGVALVGVAGYVIRRRRAAAV